MFKITYRLKVCTLLFWQIEKKRCVPQTRLSQPSTMLEIKFQAIRPLKEVIQPHLPIGLPCYDLVSVIGLTLDASFLTVRSTASGKTNSQDLTGGVYKARERIHDAVADASLLAIPTSCSRVADYNPNWEWFYGFALPCGFAAFCTIHCSTCVAPDIKAMRTWHHPHLPPS